MEAVRHQFDVDAHRSDRQRLAEPCEAINRWVAGHTRGRITRLVDARGADAALGVPTAFQRAGADFSGMNGFAPPHERSLFVSRVDHQATIDVDEAGTEATTATAFEFERRSAKCHRPRPIPEFRADHPFLFAIRHRASGDIVFLGRVSAPVRARPHLS